MGTVANPSPGATLTQVYNGIIGPSCALAACHGNAAAPTGSLDMSSQAAAFANLVNQPALGQAGVPSCAGSGLIRVVPGSAMSSLLWNKVNGTQTCGARMPNGLQPIAQGQIDQIASWINAGAMNN
jgi:hypothetical protein